VPVRRLVKDVLNGGNLDALDEICTPKMATAARAWIKPFRTSFPDVHMDIVTLLAERDMVAGRFACSATHSAAWQGHPPTGRRFRNVDEVYFFTITDGLIAASWGLEDTESRLRQLGLTSDRP
jgi:predicted ester cyclase